MDNFNNIINQFHYRFYSYKHVVSVKSIWFWITIFSVAGVIASVFSWLGIYEIIVLNIPNTYKFALSIGFTILGMLNFARYNMERDKFSIEECQREFKTQETNISKLQRIWLMTHLPYKRADYLSLAENLDKIILYKEKYKGVTDFTLKNIFELIISGESKNRLIAMFMGLAAFIMALSIASGANLGTLLYFIDEISPKSLFSIFIYMPFILFVGALEIKFLIFFLYRGLNLFLDNYNSVNGYSYLRAKTFINQLIRHYSFEKPRKKACVEQ